jgi:hypothetical protein
VTEIEREDSSDRCLEVEGIDEWYLIFETEDGGN